MRRAAFLSLLVVACAPSGPMLDAAGRIEALRSRFGTALAPAVESDPAVTVALGEHSSDCVRVRSVGRDVAMAFRLLGGAEVRAAEVDGLAVYAAGGPGHADVIQRTTHSGVEDFVYFDLQPEAEELRYQIDVTEVAGLRLRSNVLELLDADGVPRLRAARPYVVDATGVRQPAGLAVDGCAYDVDPRRPQGRAVLPPGAARCGLVVTWSGVRYPALVDPAWTTTSDTCTRHAGARR